MLSYEVNIEDGGIATIIQKLQRSLDARQALNEALGSAAAESVRRHMAATKKSPNTQWWARAAKSVKYDFNQDNAVVYATQRGVRLRVEGGVVTQKPGGPLLALPTQSVPIADNTRRAPRELTLAFVRGRGGKGGHTKGYLVEGVKSTVKRGKNKGKSTNKPKKGGALMYVLRTQTTHRPDPSVLPDDASLNANLIRAGEDFLQAMEL